MDDDSFYGGFGIGVIITCIMLLLFVVGFSIGYDNGTSAGEKKMALIAIQAINKIQKDYRPGMKIQTPFTEEDMKDLSDDTKNILKLMK